jgi:hypothetical protein
MPAHSKYLLDSQDYRLGRRALELIADPMAGRPGTRGHRGFANHRVTRPPTKAPKQAAPRQSHKQTPVIAFGCFRCGPPRIAWNAASWR